MNESLALVIEGASLQALLSPSTAGSPRPRVSLRGMSSVRRAANFLFGLSSDKSKALNDEDALVELAQQCKAVVACRVSPLQKAAIVRMVKTRVSPEPMTLAIGDGANDVSMIQEAHVGVGISGREGMQAVRASDFAISQFRFLSQLLIVHGRWNYKRVSQVILYSFYKNILFVLILFYYSFVNAFSGTTLFESWVGAGWNVAFTFFPILVFGMRNMDISMASARAYPVVYRVCGRVCVVAEFV